MTRIATGEKWWSQSESYRESEYYIKLQSSNVIPKWDQVTRCQAPNSSRLCDTWKDVDPAASVNSVLRITHHLTISSLFLSLRILIRLSLSLSLKQESPHRPQLSSPFTNKSHKILFFLDILFTNLLHAVPLSHPNRNPKTHSIPKYSNKNGRF